MATRAQPAWIATGSSYTNFTTTWGAPQQVLTMVAGAFNNLFLGVPNSSGLGSATAFAATLQFTLTGYAAGSLRVAITTSSASTSQMIVFTAIQESYIVPFSLATTDTMINIFLGGTSPGAAAAQTAVTLKAADWSIFLGSTATVFTGDLTVSGTLTSATTVSTVVNGKIVEAENELVTMPTCISTFQGPV